jgi:hypothetical protein
MRYNIRMAVVRELSAPGLFGLDSILGAIENLFGRAADSIKALTGIAAGQGIAGSILGGMKSVLGPLASSGASFLAMSQSLLTTVTGAVSAVGNIVSAPLGAIYLLAMSVQQAGRNVFASLASIAGLPASVAYQINSIVAGFQAAYCNLVNGFDQLRRMFDLDPLFGASNCSSTGGGRPPSTFTQARTNPFASIYAATATATVQTPASAQATASAVASDPLTTSRTNAQAAVVLTDIRDGILAA